VHVDVEAVVGAKSHCVSTGVEGTGCELTHALVIAVVKGLEGAAAGVVEHDLHSKERKEEV
jgi:hypothetical protein